MLAEPYCNNCDEIKKSAVEDGDYLTVRKEYMFRSLQSGEVMFSDEKGCGLDFYTSNVTPPDYISQEFWRWSELEICQCTQAGRKALDE